MSYSCAIFGEVDSSDRSLKLLLQAFDPIDALILQFFSQKSFGKEDGWIKTTRLAIAKTYNLRHNTVCNRIRKFIDRGMLHLKSVGINDFRFQLVAEAITRVVARDSGSDIPDSGSDTHIEDPFKNIQEGSENTQEGAACEISDLEVVLPDPDLTPDPLVNPEPQTASVLVTPISGEGEDFGDDYITVATTSTITSQSAVAKFNDRWQQPQVDGDKVTTVIELYNNGKPEHWGRATSSRIVVEQIKKLFSNGCDLEDWKAAILFYKASDFHNSPKFQSGNILFLLDRNHPDRVVVAAEKWRSTNNDRKNQLAQKIVSQRNGIPDPNNPDVMMTGLTLMLKRNIFKGAYEQNHPECPSIEYLQTYFPEILANA